MRIRFLNFASVSDANGRAAATLDFAFCPDDQGEYFIADLLPPVLQLQ
jgi:hypothetical protein